MIGLDTNVLVRYLAQDDAQQSALATRLIEQDLSASRPGFISLVVLVELCWVLKRLYAATDAELLATVTDVLDAAAFRVEQRGVVQAALAQLGQATKGKAGFADALIATLAIHHGCTQTVTFDRGAAKAAGMTLLATA
jgi:predicted nucleic-acid-binding protein